MALAPAGLAAFAAWRFSRSPICCRWRVISARPQVHLAVRLLAEAARGLPMYLADLRLSQLKAVRLGQNALLNEPKREVDQRTSLAALLSSQYIRRRTRSVRLAS